MSLRNHRGVLTRPSFIKNSKKLALFLVAVMLLWFATGIFKSNAELEPEAPKLKAMPLVEVTQSIARDKVHSVTLRGVTESPRRLVIKAETTAKVDRVTAMEGTYVHEGDPILSLEVDDRKAKAVQAEALVAQRKLEYKAARVLAKSRHKSETDVAMSLANLKAAETELLSAKIDLGYTKIVAPFKGMLQKIHVVEGELAQAQNTELATVLQVDPMLVVVEAPEKIVNAMTLGSAASVSVVNGFQKDGIISYVSHASDKATRTYAVEIEVPNSDGRVMSGMSTTVTVPIAKVTAHLVSPAAFTLDDGGILGIKTVTGDDEVAFYPVDIISEGADGAWVAGLPEVARIITVGQNFVNVGDRVRVKEAQ